MSKSGEFYTFDEVTKQLNIDESKLKRLVSEGEIRAFREGDEMKFKRTDIDTLDVESEGETREIDLTAAGEDASETLTDDLIFDEGDELDLSADDAGMATAEISSQDTFVDEGGEPVGMSTEPLDFSDDVDDFEDEPEEFVPQTSGPRTQARGGRGGRAYQQESKAGDLGWCVVLSLTLVVMFFIGMVVWSSRSAGGANTWSSVPVKLFNEDAYNVYKPKFPDPERE